MREFFLGADLWANILGGVVTAALLALVAYLWDRRKHRIIKELIGIMGRAIKHRNIGERATFTDAGQWILEAKQIEEDAVVKARELSPTAGAMVEWLDRVPPRNTNSEVERYVSILSTVIERIRGLMERHS